MIGLRTDGTAASPSPTSTDRVEPDLLGERDAAVDGVDRPARHAGGDDRRGTTPSSVRVAQPLDQQRPQLVAVGGAVLVAARTAGRRPARGRRAPRQLAELAVVAGGDDQLAVGARAAARRGTGSGGCCPSGTGRRRRRRTRWSG